MRAAFCHVPGLLVVTLLGVEVFISKTATAETALPAIRVVQNESNAPSTPEVRMRATPQHGARERTQDGEHRKHEGNGAPKISPPPTPPVSSRGASVKPTPASRGSATNLSVRGLGPIYQMPHPKSVSIGSIAGENSDGATASIEPTGQSGGDLRARPPQSLLRHSAEPADSKGTPSVSSSVSPSSTTPSTKTQSQDRITQLVTAGPSTRAITLPSWIPGNLRTAASGSLNQPSATPVTSVASGSTPAKTPRSNQATNVADLGGLVSKAANVDPFSTDKVGGPGVSVGPDLKEGKQKGSAGDLAIGPAGVLTEAVDPAATSGDPASESNNESKIVAEISPSVSTTPRSILPQSEGAQPSSAVQPGAFHSELPTARASEVTGVQAGTAPPAAPIAATPSSSLGFVATSPILFLLPFFPLLLLIYFGLRLS
jgi:hypothetical protein